LKWPTPCCAKQSLGGGNGESMSETSHRNPVGNQSHPARASHPPEASLAQRRGNPARRSVDSECAGRGNQPREIEFGEPTSWYQRKAISSAPYRLGVEDPPGCKSPGHVHKGVRPGTWENPEISAVEFRMGSGRPKVQAHRQRASAPCGSEPAGVPAVPPSEGNEARRDGLRAS
jgi:hypothetical protein